MNGPLAILRAPRLAARASHEVRGPLAVASLILEGMLDRGDVEPEAGRALDLQLMRARLAVDDLAAAAYGARAPDRLEPVGARELVEQIASAWQLERVVVPEDDAVVLVDRTRVAQAVGNLLANAIEHGEGVVELRGRVLPRALRLEVRDGGTGLRAPIRVLSRRPRYGRGHGLAIAADIAERHGGRLVAAPSARGAVVALELPVRAVVEPREASR
jgi:signal transduction histidine kinase